MNLAEQFQEIIKKKNVYYSLALDESTDCTDSAQVLCFACAITEAFKCFEEVLSLGTLKGKTRRIDVFNNTKS